MAHIGCIQCHSQMTSVDQVLHPYHDKFIFYGQAQIMLEKLGRWFMCPFCYQNYEHPCKIINHLKQRHHVTAITFTQRELMITKMQKQIAELRMEIAQLRNELEERPSPSGIPVRWVLVIALVSFFAGLILGRLIA